MSAEDFKKESGHPLAVSFLPLFLKDFLNGSGAVHFACPFALENAALH